MVLVGEHTGERFQLTRPSNVIGRGADCDMVIKKSDVSKRHCRILVSQDGAEVEDLESVNGTSLNGEPVNRHALAEGDLLAIVDYGFRVECGTCRRRREPERNALPFFAGVSPSTMP